MPKTMPAICGKVRITPKFAPEAVNMMLFGPGVTEVIKANEAIAMSSSIFNMAN
jgi:hypothetical protein